MTGSPGVRPPPCPRRRRALLSRGVGLLILALLGGMFWHPSSLQAQSNEEPGPPLQLASEMAIEASRTSVRNVLRFAGNPAIVVLDFPTLAEQGRMLNRIAAWAEKAGVPHDRLLNDAELEAAIAAAGLTPETYYLGHDYSSAVLLRFFELADSDRITLNDDEQALRQIVQRASAEPPGLGALISIPQPGPGNNLDHGARHAILHHELSHGEYFSNAAYARHVGLVWRTVLTDDERTRFRRFLAHEGYDPALEDVMVNETQAYLMFTPDKRFFNPFSLGIPAARLQSIRDALLAGMPASWLRRSAEVDGDGQRH